MIVTLTQDELDFVQSMVDARMALGKKSKRVSKMAEDRIVFMGIAGELACAKGLECTFDPLPHRGGDGHTGDLRRGNISIGIKTRHRHLPPDFLFPTGQVPHGFPDDYGVVGRWLENYHTLQIMGWFNKIAFAENATHIIVSGSRSGRIETRWGYPGSFLNTNISTLKEKLNGIEDAEVCALQSQGCQRYFRDRQRRRGGDLHGWEGGPTLADTLPLDSPLRHYC